MTSAIARSSAGPAPASPDHDSTGIPSLRTRSAPPQRMPNARAETAERGLLAS